MRLPPLFPASQWFYRDGYSTLLAWWCSRKHAMGLSYCGGDPFTPEEEEQANKYPQTSCTQQCYDHWSTKSPPHCLEEACCCNWEGGCSTDMKAYGCSSLCRCQRFLIIKKIDQAAARQYSPKGYEQADLEHTFLIYKLGGHSTANIAHKSLGIPSITATKRHIAMTPLQASPGFPNQWELTSNLNHCYPAPLPPSNSLVVLPVAMLLDDDTRCTGMNVKVWNTWNKDQVPQENPKTPNTHSHTLHTHYHNLGARVWGLWYWKISLVS